MIARSLSETSAIQAGHAPNDPGRQLAVTMRKRRLDDDVLVSDAPGKERNTIVCMLAANEEIRKAVDKYDEYVAFMADRIPT